MSAPEIESAYILHSRQFRDTSLILDLFTLNHGRVSVLAKGARKSTKWKGILQLFTPLVVSWRGKSELPTLTLAEAESPGLMLLGNRLLSGLYINELLVRLIEKSDPHPALYHLYQQTMAHLPESDLQACLRRFEKGLLRCIGYGLVLDRELETQHAIVPESYYQYHLQFGARCIDTESHLINKEVIYSGKSLLALHHEQFDEPEVLQDAKRLMRQALAELLHHKPLKTRELFNASL